jgi:hypothetical protein
MELSQGVITQLAGAFYLVNLMQRLDMPASIEAHWPWLSQVGSWGLLELFARALLTEEEGPKGDPLWGVLAQLEGRQPGILPGMESSDLAEIGSQASRETPSIANEPPSFRLPPRWQKGMAPSPGRPFHWNSDGQSLVAWSTDGYVLLDVAATGQAAEPRLRRLLSKYQPRPTLKRQSRNEVPLVACNRGLLADLEPMVAWWLARAVPFIRYRLCSDLNVSANDLTSTLFQHRGRLYVSPTHLDVVLELDEISVPVRLAGLDVNPGWLATFGRVVAFYFE